MLPKRVPLWAEYSTARDVLFVSVRPVRHTLSEPAAADFFWLRDADTAEIVGFECPFFSRNVRDRDWLFSLPVEPTFTTEGAASPRRLADLLPELWWVLEEHHGAALALG